MSVEIRLIESNKLIGYADLLSDGGQIGTVLWYDDAALIIVGVIPGVAVFVDVLSQRFVEALSPLLAQGAERD